MKILVTGCAGFIGFHLCKNLFKKKNYVFGIDNLNSYYDLQLKNDRLSILKKNQSFKFFKLDISDTVKLRNLFKKNNFDVVINLAAQAGVRFSIQNPKTYFESNILGFYNILFFSKEFKVKHLLYASTSSVYGDHNFFPTIETHDTDKPLSFYAASKKTNEVMAHAFSNIYKLNTTGLRFFTVYGPYGRPDMAIYKFTNAIRKNISLELYNKVNHY